MAVKLDDFLDLLLVRVSINLAHFSDEVGNLTQTQIFSGADGRGAGKFGAH